MWGSGSFRPTCPAGTFGAMMAASSTTRRSSVRARRASASPLCRSAGAWTPVRRESSALHRASACHGLCASKLEDQLQQRPRSALRHECQRGGQRWLTLTLSSWGTSPWSPDGRRIAFGSGRDGSGDVMNADGSAQRNLTHNPSHDFAPAWSPDGRRIAFLRNRGGNSEIYVMNADGAGSATSPATRQTTAPLPGRPTGESPSRVTATATGRSTSWPPTGAGSKADAHGRRLRPCVAGRAEDRLREPARR